jgi:hypothetical protein
VSGPSAAAEIGGAMKRLVLAALAALAVRAEAQTVPPVHVFTTVDAVLIEWSNVYVTGVVEGETAARRIGFVFSSSYASQRESCERLLLLAMSKPGQYRVHLQQYSLLATCTLERVAQ